MGKDEEALKHYDQALQLFRQLRIPSSEASVLSNSAEAYYRDGKMKEALELSNQALPIHRSLNNRDGIAATLYRLGKIYQAIGEPQQSLAHYLEALPIIQSLGREREVAFTLTNLGLIYGSIGENQKAFDHHVRAIDMLRKIDDKISEAAALNNLGLLFRSLGDDQKALLYYNQAFQLVDQKFPYGVATILNAFGVIYDGLGKKQEAIGYLGRALEKRRELNDRDGEAYTLYNLGRIYSSLGSKVEALEHYHNASTIWKEVGNRAKVADIHTALGKLHRESREIEKADDHLGQALDLHRRVMSRSGEAATLLEIARLERDRDQLDKARSVIESATDIVELLRGSVVSQELRSAYFATVTGYYDLYIDLLMQMYKRRRDKGLEKAALQISEGARARSLLELLAQAGANIRQGVEPQLAERERRLQQRINAKAAIVQRLRNSERTEGEAAPLKDEIDRLWIELQQVQSEIQRKSPRYATFTQPQTLSVPEIQSQLDADTLLLEYALGDERSYLWAVTPTSIDSYELPKRAEVEDLARRVHNLLSGMGARRCDETVAQWMARRSKAEAQYPEEASRLSQILLGPVAEKLKQNRLVIVPDGALHYVPFAALPRPPSERRDDRAINSRLATRDPGSFTPLIVGHELVNLPSASTIAAQRSTLAGRRLAPKTLAVLADPVFAKDDDRFNPDPPPGNRPVKRQGREFPCAGAPDPSPLRWERLYYSGGEASRILALAPAKERLEAIGFRASRAIAMSKELGKYRMIHFATHGKADSERPQLSTLVLSLIDENGAEQDGYLRAHELYNMHLPAELVVLSACETGLGGLIKGEGIIGLTRGFMYAGAKRVVVSLWNVNDAATADLMTTFYREMLNKGLRPATALRAAQIEMWKGKRFSSPYYWAGFVLQGEWK